MKLKPRVFITVTVYNRLPRSPRMALEVSYFKANVLSFNWCKVFTLSVLFFKKNCFPFFAPRNKGTNGVAQQASQNGGKTNGTKIYIVGGRHVSPLCVFFFWNTFFST